MKHQNANPFLVLGLPESADSEQVRKAYYALVQNFPPESRPEEFQALAAAYELLKDELSRERYKLFGRHLDSLSCTSDLLPPPALFSGKRQRVPFTAWLNDLRNLHHD